MGEPDIDLYADDLDNGFNSDFNNDDNEDLYNDVISAPSDDHSDGRPRSHGSSSPHRNERGSSGRRSTAYIGNLTWWTTDQDIADAIKNVGVMDVMEVKFFENRANGQSKGFCVVSFGSENSLHTVMDKLPKKDLHGQNPIVTQHTPNNLTYFEMQSQKGQAGNRHERDNMNERRSRNFEREREDPRGHSQDRMRTRSHQPPQHYPPPPQRGPPGPHMQHPQGPPQGPPPSQYPSERAPWMTGPPPQIHQMPPPIGGRPNAPPTNVPPPPGMPGLPPPRHGAPPPTNIHIPPPTPTRGPPPPMNLRHVPPPDTRGPPPPTSHEWDRPNLNQPPPQVGPPSRPPPPMHAPGQGLPPQLMPPSSHAPSPHVNPAFFQHQGIPPGLVATSPSSDMYSRPPPSQIPEYRPSERQDSSTPTISDSEFEEIMARNRTVSSSAIARAVSDASTGDYASAIETLVTAISLIKQSKVANDERCKILISSLQDTLHGIESKSYGSRSKDRARSRERERSRERSRREKSSRRDRSRSRDREYRDRSRERDRYHEDRYRDKDRDHDRRSSRR